MLKHIRFLREHVERKIFSRKKEKVEHNARRRGGPCCRFVCTKLVPSYIKAINKSFEYKRIVPGVNYRGEQKSGDKQTSSTAGYLERCCAFVDAFSLGGTFALGFTLCHNLNIHRKKVFEDVSEFESAKKNCALSKVLHNNSILKSILFKRVLAQPHNVLNVKAIENGGGDHRSSLPVYGPMTAEEALTEATEGLRSAHNVAMGELENRLGLRCVSKKRYRKAVIHFSAGTALQNSSAAFNLAQCYELGLGTSQDYSKAANHYRTASDLGNANAMYNLAIFYVRGLGSLKCDREQAYKLMEKAASLGNPRAKLLVDKRQKSKAVTAEESKMESSRKLEAIQETKQVIETLLKSNAQTYQLPYTSLKLDENVSFNSGSTGYSSVSRNSVLFSDFDMSASSTAYYSGVCYENGIGVKQNINKAIERYSLATRDGDSQAMCNLAACYETTASLNENANSYQIPVLMELYRMAAKQGHHYAVERVKELEIYAILGTLKEHLSKPSAAYKASSTH